MDQTTQRNAAMVEQSTAASHTMAQETAELADLIGQFQVQKSAGASRDVVVPGAGRQAQYLSMDGGARRARSA